MKKILIAICLLLSCLCLQAQTNKWYLAPELGITDVGKSSYFHSGITVGYYPNERPYRIDLNTSYVFNSDNNIFTAAALTTGELRESKWISTGSLGLGMQKISSRDKVDFVYLLGLSSGYQLTEKLLLGIKVSVTCNVNAEIYPVQSNIFLAIRL